MKKLTLAALMVSSVLASSAFAAGYNGPAAAAGGYNGPATAGGGYNGPAAAARITTVAEASNARDDTHVVLEGNIVQRLPKHERYEFKDATGTIVVEIDDDDWPYNTNIDENTKVRLYGEVDRGRHKVEIDVDHLQVIQ